MSTAWSSLEFDEDGQHRVWRRDELDRQLLSEAKQLGREAYEIPQSKPRPWQRKLSNQQRATIRRRRARGMTYRALAAEHRVAESAIRAICKETER